MKYRILHHNIESVDGGRSEIRIKNLLRIESPTQEGLKWIYSEIFKGKAEKERFKRNGNY